MRRSAYLVFGQDYEQASFEGVPFRHGTCPLDPEGLGSGDGNRGGRRNRAVLRWSTSRPKAAIGDRGIGDGATQTGVGMEGVGTRQIGIPKIDSSTFRSS